MANRRMVNEFSSSSLLSINDNGNDDDGDDDDDDDNDDDDDDDRKDSKVPVAPSVNQSLENISWIANEPGSSTESVESLSLRLNNDNKAVGENDLETPPTVPVGVDLPRREENPFSFKHFLSKDLRIDYNSTGARPKIYSPVRKAMEKSQNTGSRTDNIYSRNPTELPDFVQDHLVIEQCYLSHEAASTAASTTGPGVDDPPSPITDMDNLPDFTLTGVEQRQAPSRDPCRKCEKSEYSGDLPFDLTGGLERRKRGKHSVVGKANLGCAELSSFGTRPDHLPIGQVDLSIGRMSDVNEFPFDLPPAATPEPRMSNDEMRIRPNNSPANEASANKSLPDFLNDGPIRKRVGAPSTVESTASFENRASENSSASLLLENERLRDELQIARRQIAEGTRMIESLKAELNSRRRDDHEETAHLEEAMERVEANLKQSTKRTTSAENAVALLKQRVKALTAEIAILRAENQQLSSLTGAEYRTPATERRIKKLSDELREAATSAEGSLRQLISGVNNLRVLASALENVDRIEDRTKDFLPDFEEENAAGPAL